MERPASSTSANDAAGCVDSAGAASPSLVTCAVSLCTSSLLCICSSPLPSMGFSSTSMESAAPGAAALLEDGAAEAAAASLESGSMTMGSEDASVARSESVLSSPSGSELPVFNCNGGGGLTRSTLTSIIHGGAILNSSSYDSSASSMYFLISSDVNLRSRLPG